MTSADSYRERAADLKAKVANEPSATLAAEWEQLARAYLRLAEQADRNDKLDLRLVEFGSVPPPRTRP